MDASPERTRPDLDEVYRRCMGPLLERARGWFPTLRGSERDLYQAAWASLLGATRTIDDVEKYLEAALYSAGLKELRRRRRRPTVSLSAARFKNGNGGSAAWQQGPEALTDRTASLPEEQVESREDARLVTELLEDLTPLQRRIIKLRWGCGLRRRETAELLGISQRSLKREMEKAEPVIARSVELARAGRWCEPKKSLVLAYSLGLLSATRATKARMHLERCGACRAVANSVRSRLEKVASVLPLPTLSPDGSQGVVTRAAELGESIHSGLADLATGAKQHGLALFTRTPAVDGTASQVAVGGGLKGSGSMIAAVAACVAAGGGATYCAVEGVPTPVRDIAGIQEHPQQKSGAQPKADERPAPTQPVATVPQPEPTEPQAEPPENGSAQESQETNTAPVSPAPAGSSEFGSAAPTRRTSAAAPAPEAGGGEFTP